MSRYDIEQAIDDAQNIEDCAVDVRQDLDNWLDTGDDTYLNSAIDSLDKISDIADEVRTTIDDAVYKATPFGRDEARADERREI